jgi:predicted nucleic acid-binding protein
MKKVFVDTNIIIDLLADRKPFSKLAIELFTISEQGKIKLYTSSHTICTIHYILKKYHNEIDLRKLLLKLLEKINVKAIDLDIIKMGLNSQHKDFEDAIQIYTASKIENIYCIVTRNIKDFKNSEIPAYSLEDFFANLD